MTTDIKQLESIGHLVASLQTPHSCVNRAIEQLGIRPTVTINGIPHFDGNQCEAIAAAAPITGAAMRFELEQLAALLIPECPPYVVLESDNPPASLQMPGAVGCTGRTADLLCRDWLTVRGEWHGRAPLIWVNDITVGDWCALPDESGEPRGGAYGRQVLSAIVAHECGHIAEKPIDLSEATPARVCFAEAIATYSAVVQEDTTWPPFTGHDATFVRLALHAAFRAHKAGFVFPIDYLFSSDGYGLPAYPSDFKYALGDEPLCLASEPLFEIRSFQSPFHFRKLWNRAVNYWVSQQSPGAQAVKYALAMIESEELICHRIMS